MRQHGRVYSGISALELPKRPVRLTGNRYTDRRAQALLDRAQTRPMRVLVDAEVLASQRWPDPRPAALLTTLLTHPLIEAFHYHVAATEVPRADNGRPQWDEPEAVGVFTGGPGNESITVVYLNPSDGGLVETGIAGDHGGLDLGDQTYAYLSPDEAAERRRSDTLVSSVAHRLKADLLITDRPYLLSRRWPGTRDMTVCSSTEAIALVGLFLRCRSQYILTPNFQHGPLLRASRDMFMRLALSEMLPACDRWSLYISAASFDDTEKNAFRIATSVTERLTRALIMRDAVLRTSCLPRSTDQSEDLMLAFDSLLLFLMGALDGTARIAHLAVGLPGAESDAGWQRGRWKAKLLKHAPGFADHVGDGTAGADLLTVLSRLRNTIHGAGIESRVLSRAGDFSPAGKEPVVLLPQRDALVVRPALERRGWDEAWGLHIDSSGAVLLNPDNVGTDLVRELLTLLNDLMSCTPTENLLRTDVALQDPESGHVDPSGVFTADNRYAAAIQLGLIDASRC